MKNFIPKLMKLILKWMKFILIIVKNCLRQALLRRFMSNPTLYLFLMLLHSIKRIHLYHLDGNISSILQMDYEVTSKMSDVSADFDCGLDNGNHCLLQSNGLVDSHLKLRRTLEFRTKPKVRLQ